MWLMSTVLCNYKKVAFIRHLCCCKDRSFLRMSYVMWNLLKVSTWKKEIKKSPSCVLISWESRKCSKPGLTGRTEIFLRRAVFHGLQEYRELFSIQPVPSISSPAMEVFDPLPYLPLLIINFLLSPFWDIGCVSTFWVLVIRCFYLVIYIAR